MKKFGLLAGLVLATTSIGAFADSHGGFKGDNAHSKMSQAYHKGGFINTEQAVISVSKLDSIADDQYVVLQGKIIKQIGKDDFLFRDASGEITVEIERKAWAGQEITPKDEVKLYGEVDKSWNKTEVEIHRVEKLK